MEESPSKLRLAQLGSKLASLQGNIEEDKSNRLDTFLGKLKNVEDKLARGSTADEQKIKNLRDQIG